MKVDLKDLRESPMELAVKASPESLELEDPDFRFESPVEGTVTFRVVGDRVMAAGDIHTQAIAQCVRCLTDVPLLVRGTMDAVYENDEELLKPERQAFGSEEQIITYYDGESIHPEPELRETLMLELPLRTLCSEDCKGLCPNCGENLNEGDCKCVRDLDGGSSWKAALKSIKIEEK